MNKYLFSFFLPFFFSAGLIVRGQEVSPAGSSEKLLESVKSYMSSMGNHAVLYNNAWNINTVGINVQSMFLRPGGYVELDNWGSEIIPLPYSELRESYTPGQLIYNGIFYPDVDLRLDQYRDLLFILGGGGSIEATLDPYKVDYAVVQGYVVKYVSPENSGLRLTPGYYQQLYSRRYDILKKTTYVFKAEENKFTDMKHRYYVVKEGVAYPVEKRQDIARVMGISNREVKEIARRYGLTFKPDNNFEKAVVTLVRTFENN